MEAAVLTGFVTGALIDFLAETAIRNMNLERITSGVLLKRSLSDFKQIYWRA